MFCDVLRAMRMACSSAPSVRNNQTGSTVVSKNDKQLGNSDQNLKNVDGERKRV